MIVLATHHHEQVLVRGQFRGSTTGRLSEEGTGNAPARGPYAKLSLLYNRFPTTSDCDSLKGLFFQLIRSVTNCSKIWYDCPSFRTSTSYFAFYFPRNHQAFKIVSFSHKKLINYLIKIVRL